MKYMLNRYITNWIRDNFGESEAEEPCYNIEYLSDAILERFCVELEEDTELLAWDLFYSFFRYVKGYQDWTDEEITNSMNKDDIEQLCKYIKDTLDYDGKER